MIYIDPPYNTGGTLMYNNNYVDQDDPYRHSKFLSFLHKRLKLAKNVLKKNGVICCTIDDYELISVLGILEKLHAKILNIVVIVIKPEGRGQDHHIMGSHEYAIFATWGDPISRKILPRVEIKQNYDEVSSDGRQYRWDTFYRRGDKKPNPEKESRWYPIYVDSKTLKISASKKKGYKNVFPIDTKGTKWIWDMLPEDFEEEIKNMDRNDPEIIAKKNKKTDQITIHIRRYKKYFSKPVSYWKHEDYSPQAYGSKLVPRIIGKDIKFDYPKSVFAVYDCIDIFLPENGILLDFFAGSGTSAHAVQLLNLRDIDMDNTFVRKYGQNYHTNTKFLDHDAKLYLSSNAFGRKELSHDELSKKWALWRKNHGQRQFIICTNNEIPEKILTKLRKQKSWTRKKELKHPEGICKKITYPRMIGISKGYGWNESQARKLVHPISSQGDILPYEKSLTDKIPKIPFRMKYFKTDFIESKRTDSNRRKIMKCITETLCIKEDCFKLIHNQYPKYHVFANNSQSRYLGILYDNKGDTISEFTKYVKKNTSLKKICTYVMSYSSYIDPDDFQSINKRVELHPVPDALLDAYMKQRGKL